MVDGPMSLPPKVKNVSFFDPKQEAEVKRKRMLAEALMKQADSINMDNEMVSGIVVKKSPIEGLAKALQTGLAGNAAGQASKAEGELDAMKYAQALADKEEGYARDDFEWNREAALKRELDGSGATPEYDNYTNAQKDPKFQAHLDEQKSAAIMLANRLAQTRGRTQANEQDLMEAAKVIKYGEGMVPMSPPMPQGVPAGQPPMSQPQVPPTPQTPPVGQGNVPAVNGAMPQPAPTQAPIGVGVMAGYTDAAGEIAKAKELGTQNAKIDTAAELKRQETLGSPMPATVVQAQDELLDKINIGNGIAQKMDKFTAQIDSGQLNLDVLGNIANKMKNNLSVSDQESANFASFNAALQALRNDSLRLNTGVQTDGDSQRAWAELIENINDPKVVRQRLQEIKAINVRGAALQRERMEIMRKEYGREALPPSQAETQPQRLKFNPATGDFE